ncbi:hypothetical protein BH24ACT5_BH24ACT5_20520 [soil metagenome]
MWVLGLVVLVAASAMILGDVGRLLARKNTTVAALVALVAATPFAVISGRLAADHSTLLRSLAVGTILVGASGAGVVVARRGAMARETSTRTETAAGPIGERQGIVIDPVIPAGVAAGVAVTVLSAGIHHLFRAVGVPAGSLAIVGVVLLALYIVLAAS